MIRKFFSRKIVIILLIQIMMLLWFSVSIQNFSIDVRYPVAPWVCVFYFINPFFAMVWQICVIFFFSDAPFLQYKEMYRMIRLGRKRWFWKMQGYVVGSSAALFFIEAGLSILLFLPCGIDWTWDWGRLLYTLAMTNVETEYSLLAVFPYTLMIRYTALEPSVYKGYKQDKIEMRGDRAEMSDFPLYLNTVAGGLDRRDQTIGGFSFVVKIYAVPVVEIIG